MIVLKVIEVIVESSLGLKRKFMQNDEEQRE
jgi:hypothetical protein